MNGLVENFHFLRPWWLVALVPLVLGIGLLAKKTNRVGLWENICDPELLPYVTEKISGKTNRLSVLLSIAGIASIVALAGPTWEQLPTPVFRQESALVLVLDLSRSMNAEDVKPSRLERAKFKISDILRLRKDGQTALVVFADQPYVVTPLTNDANTIENQLPALTSEIMPSQGSNLVSAIEKAAELLTQAGIRGGDILILTDAVKSDPDAVGKLAQTQNIRISVIGIGSEAGAPVTNERGNFIADESGNVVLMTLDIVGLRELATTGNGLYQTIATDNRDVSRYVRFIEQRDSSKAESSSDLFAERWREFGPWLLVACLPLLPFGFRRGVLGVLIASHLGFMTLPAGADEVSAQPSNYWFFSKDQTGQQAFNDKDFAAAKQHFETDAWRAAAAYRDGDFAAAELALTEPQSPDDWYNKGNALARQGMYEDAIAAYEQTLSTIESHEDAAHNKALLEKLIEEQQSQQQSQGDGENNEQQDQDSNGESEGENSEAAESEQQGGDSNAESPQMNEQQQDEQATQSSEREEENEEQQIAEEQKEQDNQGQQESGKPNETLAESQPEPNAELEQATEQWLRQIPDDPGGLLRRKFEYEHQRRGLRKNKGGQAW
ncbi:MAG: VWA domain-containing protein [Pseudomonadota bacterium]